MYYFVYLLFSSIYEERQQIVNANSEQIVLK